MARRRRTPRNTVARRARRTAYLERQLGPEVHHAAHAGHLPARSSNRAAARRAQARDAAKRAHSAGKSVHRQRRALAPVYASGALAGAAQLAHLIPGGWLPAAALGLSPSAWTAARRALDRRNGVAVTHLTPWQKAGSWARLAVATWLPAAATSGIAGGGLLARDSLLAGGLTGAVTWWIHMARHPAAPPNDDVIDVESTDVAGEILGPIETIWQRIARRPSGAIPGSYLTGVKQHDDDWFEADVVLDLDHGTAQDVIGQQRVLRQIAARYGVPVSAVSITLPRDGSGERFHLAVYRRHPLVKPLLFRGPTLDAEGWITVGYLPSGAPARWRLWIPGSGVCHGMISGATGSGKSGLVSDLCAEITQSGRAVLWFADGQGGLSAPDWQDRGPRWFAGDIVETYRMLRAVERVMAGRARRRRRVRWFDERGFEHRGKGSFDPTPEEPALFVILDEWPELAHDQTPMYDDEGKVIGTYSEECARIVGRVGKIGRKVGVGAVVVSLVPSVTELSPGTDGGAIRAQLASMNIAVFRISAADRNTANMSGISAMDVDPADIPETFPDGSSTVGLGFIKAAAGSDKSPMRGVFVERPIEWAHRASDLDLEPEAIADAGADYATWRERRDRADDADEFGELLDDDHDDERDWELSPTPRPDASRPATPARPATVTPSRSAGPSVRETVVSVLRATRSDMSTNELTAHVKALGVTAERKVVAQALGRARDAGEVEQIDSPPYGEDRSDRWRLATPDDVDQLLNA